LGASEQIVVKYSPNGERLLALHGGIKWKI
jgi:hypothetical protein